MNRKEQLINMSRTASVSPTGHVTEEMRVAPGMRGSNTLDIVIDTISPEGQEALPGGLVAVFIGSTFAPKALAAAVGVDIVRANNPLAGIDTPWTDGREVINLAKIFPIRTSVNSHHSLSHAFDGMPVLLSDLKMRTSDTANFSQSIITLEHNPDGEIKKRQVKLDPYREVNGEGILDAIEVLDEDFVLSPRTAVFFSNVRPNSSINLYWKIERYQSSNSMAPFVPHGN